LSCDDGNVCTANVCQAGVCGVDSNLDGVSCVDAVECTDNVCQAGVCGVVNDSSCLVRPDCGSVMCTLDGCVYSSCSLPDPVLYLPFDGNTNDSGVFVRDVVSVGGGVSSFVDGYLNESAVFSGGYLGAGSWDVVGDELTLAAWVDPDSVDGCGARILSKADGSADVDHFFMLGFCEGQLRSRVQTSGGVVTLFGGTVSADEGWFHAAVTYDGSVVKLFKNGVEVASTSLSGELLVDSSVEVLVGANFGGYGLFDGLIDELYVFNVSLSEGEINDLKNSGVVIPSPINRFDLDGDGHVDVGDLLELMSVFDSDSVFGDFNEDNQVNILDVIILIKHFD